MILPYTSRGVLYAAKLITGESAGVHGPPLALVLALPPLSLLHAARTRTATRGAMKPGSLRTQADIRSPFDRPGFDRGEWTASGGPVNRKE